jgi:hypothetical protein
MGDSWLLQSEADALLILPKVRVDDTEHEYPGLGGKLQIELNSRDKREHFLLNISRGRIEIRRGTYQTRARGTVILARLDFGGAPHRNPDGVEIGTPHLHLYREGYGDKWAFAVPTESFPNTDDRWQTLHDFMRYCQVEEPPRIVRGLFA